MKPHDYFDHPDQRREYLAHHGFADHSNISILYECWSLLERHLDQLRRDHGSLFSDPLESITKTEVRQFFTHLLSLHKDEGIK
jgi:hypothetical protein